MNRSKRDDNDNFFCVRMVVWYLFDWVASICLSYEDICLFEPSLHIVWFNSFWRVRGVSSVQQEPSESRVKYVAFIIINSKLRF